MGDLDDFYVHTLTVHTLTGTGAMGDVFAAPVTVPGWLEDKRRRADTTRSGVNPGSHPISDLRARGIPERLQHRRVGRQPGIIHAIH